MRTRRRAGKRFSAPGAIGICWRSGKLGGHRSIGFAPLEQWGAFLRDTDAHASSACSMTPGPKRSPNWKRLSGKTIIVPQGIDQKNELDRAAALMAALEPGGQRADRGRLPVGGGGHAHLEIAVWPELDGDGPRL